MTTQQCPGVRHAHTDGLSCIPEQLEACDCYNAGQDVCYLPCGGCPYCTKLHSQWSKFENEVDYGVFLATRHISSLEVSATSAIPATSNDVVDPSYTKQYRPDEMRNSQMLDSELQPVIHWMKGEAPTQNEVQLQDKTTPILWNWSVLLSNANCVSKRDSPKRTYVLPYVRRTLREWGHFDQYGVNHVA